MKRRLLLILIAVLLAVALAQDAPSWPQFETRLSIVETRLSLVESELLGLKSVPVQLGRIEEKIPALTERSLGNSAVLQMVGGGIVLTVITSVITYHMGKQKGASAS